MIDLRALTRFRQSIDFVLKMMEAHGIAGKIKTIDTTTKGLILHMENGTRWIVGIEVHRLDSAVDAERVG